MLLVEDLTMMKASAKRIWAGLLTIFPQPDGRDGAP